jgi:quinol monooxygenase YgiN
MSGLDDFVTNHLFRYKDAAAFQAHCEAPYLKEALGRTGDVLEKAAEVLVMTRYGGFKRT